MQNSISFIEKYEPKTTSEFIGNENIINDIKDWIITFDDATKSLRKNKMLKKNTKGRKMGTSKFSEIDKKHSVKKGNLLIQGDHGTGKTTLIKLILNEINYIKIPITNFNCKLNIVLTQIKNCINMTKNPVLIIDEIDSLIQTNEKKNIEEILKINNYERFIPIIILSNGNHSSKLTKTKKIANTLELLKCNKTDIKDFLFKICKLENININYIYFDKIIENEHGDIRKLLIFLEEISKIFSGLKITKDNIDDYMKIFQSKDFTKDLFSITSKIMLQDLNILDCLKNCFINTTMIPMTIYENYHKCVNNKSYYLIMSKISYSDIIENYIYSDQNWDLNGIVNILNCVIPAYYINKNKTTNTVYLKYASDCNKTSLRKNKRKKNIGNNSIEEFIYTIE